MSGKKYPDTFSDAAKKRIDFVLEYKEMKKGRASFSGEIDNTLKGASGNS
jgi:N-acetyl-gamma-glutamylphosphate reductase